MADAQRSVVSTAGESEASSNATLRLIAHVVEQRQAPIVPAAAKRKWMDDTDASFANRCLPLLIANQWGWFILNDRKIELIWNGGLHTSDLHIHYSKRSPDERIDAERLSAVSHFGYGILTFRFPYLMRTPPGWNLCVRGPANWCKDGICPLDGIVETDWSSMTFTMNWKITRKDTWIAFEEDEPICQIFPIPRGSAEAFLPEIRALSNNPELETKYKEWRCSRTEFNRAQRKSGVRTLWQKHYFHGTSVLGDAFSGHQTKLAVREFTDNRSQTTTDPVAETLAAANAPTPCPWQGESTSRPPLLSKPVGADFEIVVSSENSSYMAWQTQLFCFSALTRLGKLPTVVVHRGNGPLRPEFSVLRKWGCRLIEAPQFRLHPKGDYAARNEPGSLLTISALAEFRQGHILFCEPDMLFANRAAYSGELSGEFYRYLDYNQPRLQAVARKFGIAASANELNETRRIGVPYLIPGPLLPRIAQRWIEVLDAFEELDWIDIMYAFGLALAIEDLPIKTTHLMAQNLDALQKLDRSIVHYCYGDERWSKRAYLNGASPLDCPPPSSRELSGTILGEILGQIRQAGACARFPRLFNAFRLASTLSMKYSGSHAP